MTEHAPLRQNINSLTANIICRYLALYPHEAGALKPLTEQLAASGAPINSRKTLPGHITAGGLVLNGQTALMVFHPYLRKWLQPGGHIETNETPLNACIREVLEETGLRTRLHPWHRQNAQPFDINIHAIAANPKKREAAHWHYDFRYLLKAEETAAPAISELRCAWRNLADIKEENLKNALRKLTLIAEN